MSISSASVCDNPIGKQQALAISTAMHKKKRAYVDLTAITTRYHRSINLIDRVSYMCSACREPFRGQPAYRSSFFEGRVSVVFLQRIARSNLSSYSANPAVGQTDSDSTTLRNAPSAMMRIQMCYSLQHVASLIEPDLRDVC